MDSEHRIKTDFLDRQAKDLSKGGMSGGQKGILTVVLVAVVGFLAWQGYQFIHHMQKMNELRGVGVSLENPLMRDGVALVDMKVTNYNPTSISNIKVRYHIVGPAGSDVKSDLVTIPDMVPAGDSRTIPHVSLGALSEQSSRMNAEPEEFVPGPSPKLSPEMQTKFIDLALLPNDEKQPQFESFLKTEPRFVPAYIQLARAYMSQNENAKAIAVLRKAIAIEPNYADAHYNLALALQHFGEKAAAGKELRKALDALPNDPDVQRTAQHFDGD